MNIPIVYLCFRRPYCVNKVLPIILQQKPRYLYIHSDWSENRQWQQNIKQCRKIVNESSIDWRCTLTKIYRNKNVMCQGAFRDTINRVFQDGHTMCIVVPEDCVPGDITFRWLNKKMLQYENDNKIGIISCTRGQSQMKIFPSFFIFGIYKRSSHLAVNYAQYKQQINNLTEHDLQIIDNINIKRTKIDAYKRIINMPNYMGWDILMQYYLLKNNYYSIYPQQTLVEYIGFDDPTHSHQNIQHLKTWKINHNYIIPN